MVRISFGNEEWNQGSSLESRSVQVMTQLAESRSEQAARLRSWWERRGLLREKTS